MIAQVVFKYANWTQNAFILYCNGVFYSAKDNRNSRMLAPNGTNLEIPRNSWHHMVYSLDGGKLTMYMDGNKVSITNPDTIHEFSNSHRTTQPLALGIFLIIEHIPSMVK